MTCHFDPDDPDWETLTWPQARDVCDLLMDDDRYEFAWQTLYGIRLWIVENKHVTPRQIQTIRNIKEAVE